MHPPDTSSPLSHRFGRFFVPERLIPPRDFIKPVLDDRPVYVEIGAGKGKHALSFAKAHPKCRLIAIERTTDKFAAFAKLVANSQLSNLDAVHGDAIAYIVHALPPSCLSGCFILYPNPEPHNKNQRFHQMPFFEFLLSRLQPSATIVIASNIIQYISECQEALSHIWQLPHTCHPIPAGSDRTHFETKYLARGEPCWQLTITKPFGYHTRFDHWQA